MILQLDALVRQIRAPRFSFLLILYLLVTESNSIGLMSSPEPSHVDFFFLQSVSGDRFVMNFGNIVATLRFFEDPINLKDIWQSILILIVHNILFVIIAVLKFNKKDITS